MQTLGIDLASQPERTGYCVLTWADGRARVAEAGVGIDDAGILQRAGSAHAVGIDAPFGWPDAFRRLLADGAGASARGEWTTDRRDQLRYRETDRVVRGLLGRWPLSVSTDRIALAGLRCDGLLRRLGVRDRSGRDGRVLETYPALALRRWGLPHRAYKGPEHAERRRESLAGLGRRAHWLDLGEGLRDRLVADHDAYDALIAALVARAAAAGRVAPIPAEHEACAQREGWIVVPDEDALDGLAGPV